jgi:hypothetical protein
MTLLIMSAPLQLAVISALHRWPGSLYLPISPLYLPYISALHRWRDSLYLLISPLYLPYISPMSPLYLGAPPLAGQPRRLAPGPGPEPELWPEP